MQQRPAHDGKFVVSGLPAGEYYVGAVTDLDGVDLTDAAFLDTLAAVSARITLAKGATRTIDLAIGGSGSDAYFFSGTSVTVTWLATSMYCMAAAWIIGASIFL